VKSSFALERDVDVDSLRNEVPHLAVESLRAAGGGDFRNAWTDDQAAQVMVGFTDRRVLTYIWDTTAPKGTMQNASSIPLVHIFAVVCESGAADMNRWLPEMRDVAADYERAYRQIRAACEGAAHPDQFAAHRHLGRKLDRHRGVPQ